MKKILKVRYKIGKNKYISDIEPFKTHGIPTNIFLFKTLTGGGATESEIRFHRHSIILEVNVPVIKGKCSKNKNIYGVYEGKTVEGIGKYLASEVKFKKILVTPESFERVKEAIEESDFDFYQDFFLLFDECEKIIQDVHYRGDITLPMDDFFLFENKAFVSATPIIPSDPRFAQQNFSIVEIEPTFNYTQDLSLRLTNNVLSTLTKFVNDNSRDKYFIFFNSTDNIAEVIKKNNWQNDSMIFCAKDSKKKLTLNKFKNVSTDLKAFKKFNFFTSRFNSAVDIDYSMFECNPTIIMVTDLVFALHSKIDPFTEAIQIPGRFRKPENKKEIKREIVHITNTDMSLNSMSKEEVLKYLQEAHTVYKVVDRYYEASTNVNARLVIRQMLERIDYVRFIKLPSKSRNYFMVDNLIGDELVKGYYQSNENLINAYSECKHFRLIDGIEPEIYQYTDRDRLKARPKNLPLKSLKKILSENLLQLYNARNDMSEFSFNMEITNLQFDFPDQMAPINKYGIDNSFKLKFDTNAIEEQLIKDKKDKDMFGMMTYIQRNFQEGKTYTSEEIIRILKYGFTENKIYGVSPSVKYLRKYADLSPPSNRVLIKVNADGKEIRGYKVNRIKDRTL